MAKAMDVFCFDVVCKKDEHWRWRVLFLLLDAESDGSQCVALEY